MVPKNYRKVGKIKIPTDSVPEFGLEDAIADIQWTREAMEARKREEEEQKQREEETRREEQTH